MQRKKTYFEEKFNLNYGLVLLIITMISCQSEKKETVIPEEKLSIQQEKPKISEPKDTIVTSDNHFNSAYNEIWRMLKGEQPLDFKRAVFLTEWAYKEGKIDYSDFSREISDITQKLGQFIQQKGVGQYKTAGNFALYEFFTRPNWMNGNTPFVYDFEDFTGKQDWEQTFVTKLINTHKGQCRSLPYLYKILAEELNTEAYLAVAPNHFYIKHLDEKGKWVNIELTNGNFSSDAWMISSTGMSAEAIQNGIYMEALDLRQSVAYCLTELSQGYEKKYGYDDFVVLCCNTTLEYFPKSIHTMMFKHNALMTIGKKELRALNGRKPTPEMEQRFAEFKRNEALIESLGYREMSAEKYEQWLKTIETEKQKRLANQSLTSSKRKEYPYSQSS